jgi:CBS domain-containing protein
MFSKEIAIKDIPTLKPADSGLHALALMDELKLKHLPVVRDGVFVCLVSEKDIFAMRSQKDPVENICLYAPYVLENYSILDVLHIMGKDFLTLLPVVSEAGAYVGSITLPALMAGLSELCNAGSEGALIAIETNSHDYMLSQVVRLVESNNANVLNLFTYPDRETDRQIILFKIDLEDASPVLRSLERFNYKVVYYLQKQMLPDEIQKKRLNELLYYLEM